ncbi:aldose epimerase family protein [Cognatishimia activa]|uniref:Aldose 1-epimerase n=1 Tax=Cognatishimia activa TaxID=1715691 RepID=A0A0P1IQ62_9RHOB|nr:aldose epimerase family protein [Cognatishimia activa]CUI86862.1 Aldose 1-epimerase precursor [Cognatishimia activa]CUK25595.1 Aldose 1-epimerase precursor [Cognatishimia activa]
MTTSAQDLQSITLRADGARIDLLNFGATTCDWRIVSDGQRVPLILGFDDLSDYLTSPIFCGAIAGRVSNRIGEGQFEGPNGPIKLDQNEGTTTVHGGAMGTSAVFWKLEQVSENEARMTYHSADGENGFPGNVDFEVRVILSKDSLEYIMRATVDEETPISLAQHNYYNIGGTPDIWDYQLACNSSRTLAQNDKGVCNGEVADQSDSALDFRTLRPLRKVEARGLDDHFLFDDEATHLRKVATLQSPDGIALTFYSDQLGAQLYTAHHMKEIKGGLDGQTYGKASGFCFEPQGHPNAVNIPSFPSVFVSPDKPYEQRLVIKVSGGDP